MQTRAEDYTVGWICAVGTEQVVACELLDEEYTKSDEPQIDALRDHNIYTFGRIQKHYVVIAGLPSGRYGISSTARVAQRMLSSFPALQISLLVGIAGGAPNRKNDIRLGDIVVSCPTSKHGGIIHYDFGVATQQQEFEETGHLASPPDILLNAVGALKARHKRDGHNISRVIASMLENNRRLRAEYSRPGAGLDRLYKSDYVHSNQKVCDCQALLRSEEESDLNESSYLIQRSQRGLDEDDPAIHYGLIASADRLIKDATLRDALAQKHDVLCFEMEAAGLMNSGLRCLVIRGICDYADTHKNDTWQGYAAATASAYAKELLEIIPSLHPRLPAAEIWTLPAGKTTNSSSGSTRGLADINIGVGSGNAQQSLIHPAQDNLSIDISLAGIRNVFTRSQKANRDVRIDICIEIAKRSDQLKTSVRVRHDDDAENEQERPEADHDQVFLDCILRCTKQKPLNAAEGLSRSFTGSADFSFERGSSFFPEKYSVNQTLHDRIFFLASKGTNRANGYSIEFFVNYIVKRRRWQRVHVHATAAAKIGSFAMVPVSTFHHFTSTWQPPRPFIQLLENVLQDLELTDPVAKVYLPIYSHANGTFQYDFEEVQAKVDYEQKDLLERIEVNAIRCLRDTGCAQYQESQLTTLKRLWLTEFLVTDGSNNYIEHKAPFAHTVLKVNEFKQFIEQMMKARKASEYQGVTKFIGVVLDDHRNHVKGYLLEPILSGFNAIFSWAKRKNYMIPRGLRRLWAKQLIASILELHSRGIVIGRLTMSISHSLDVLHHNFWRNFQFLPDTEGLRPPELRTGKDMASECMEYSQKSDIFQLGMLLWRLFEHVPWGKKYLCVMAGCTARPHYRCGDATHTNPISLLFSQHGDPAMRDIIKKCRTEDPNNRPSIQEVAQEFAKEVSVEDSEIEVSRQKRAFRTAMEDVLEYGNATIVRCNECYLPPLPYYFHCNICSDGGFDLCQSCVASGIHCFDNNHQLVKMRQDSSGNLIQESLISA